MPVYEYQCKECGQIEEAFQKISESPLETCSSCKGQLKKLISQSSFQLKGSGWYVTDYGGSKNQNQKKTDPDKPAASKPKESKTTSKKASDAKS